jgi:hypothetical protein
VNHHWRSGRGTSLPRLEILVSREDWNSFDWRSRLHGCRIMISNDFPKIFQVAEEFTTKRTSQKQTDRR